MNQANVVKSPNFWHWTVEVIEVIYHGQKTIMVIERNLWEDMRCLWRRLQEQKQWLQLFQELFEQTVGGFTFSFKALKITSSGQFLHWCFQFIMDCKASTDDTQKLLQFYLDLMEKRSIVSRWWKMYIHQLEPDNRLTSSFCSLAK